jgi:hypothetical protein
VKLSSRQKFSWDVERQMETLLNYTPVNTSLTTFSFCSANKAYCCMGATETFVFYNKKLFCTILDSIHQQEKQEGKDEQPKFR